MHQAVILAAGSARRLRPLTDTTPKCLLDVGGRAILDLLLDRLSEAGVTKAVVVTGHLCERIERHLSDRPPPLPVNLAWNQAFATTNNVVSLLCARPYLSSDALVICDGDVVLRGDALQRLLLEPVDCALLVDREARLADEEMKVGVDQSGLVRQLSKELHPTAAAGESIGIQKVGGAPLSRLWSVLEQLVESGRTDVFYEAAFQQLIDAGIPFRSVPVTSEDWIEIDSAEDLAEARKRLSD
jgi:choline kinase